MKTIEKCRICGDSKIQPFLDLGEQPYANSLIEKIDIKENFFPLSLSWCPNCNMVQLNQTAEPADLFSNYVWVTSTSSTAKEYSEKFCNEVLPRAGDLNKGYILEVASNDGTFLLPFIKRNLKVLGVDPAQNIVDIANKNGISTICRFFGFETANEIVKTHGPAHVVFARNVLPHVANIHNFVEGLHTNLAKDGLIVLEIHYAKIILEELHYDSIYHEHLFYYTLKSVEFLLNQHNLFIEDIGKSPISGGSLVLYVRAKRVEESAIVKSIKENEQKDKINELECWKAFAIKVKRHKKKLLEIFNESLKKYGTVVGYGASARSSTLLNYCKLNKNYISIIADQNPLKQKKYTAGTHILIESPDKVFKSNPKCVFILAWNFADEIINILKIRYNFKGQCIIPLPNNPYIKDI